jgi:energy-coupling factor transporter ATP-binding protein EcfA2
MTSVLQKLSLIAYRGVSGLELENLTPVSLVVGANNSGKSSILEAAGLFLRPPDPTQWVNAVRHRDVDMSLVDGLWSLFPGGETLHPDDGPSTSEQIAIRGSTANGERFVEARCFASQSVGADAEAVSARVEVMVDGLPAVTMKFPSSAAPAHQVPVYRVFTVTPATHYSTKALVEHLSRVVDEGKKQLAVALLQVFDKDVEDLDVIASLGREAVRVTHRTRGVVDLASFGDGMRRSAALALALTRASQGVLLVDEIEAGIHHSVLRPVLARLLEAAAASRVQILATTHSLEAVDALLDCVQPPEAGSVSGSRSGAHSASVSRSGSSEWYLPERLSAFWVQRQDGKHEVRRYDFAKLCTLREGGLDIR